MQQEIDYRKLGRRIKDIRLGRKLTQDALAEKVGCNTSHISNIENCYTKASLNMLLAISNALDTSIDSLLTEQYENTSLAVENEILRELRKCDSETKTKVLRIIQILQ